MPTSFDLSPNPRFEVSSECFRAAPCRIYESKCEKVSRSRKSFYRSLHDPPIRGQPEGLTCQSELPRFDRHRIDIYSHNRRRPLQISKASHRRRKRPSIHRHASRFVLNSGRKETVYPRLHENYESDPMCWHPSRSCGRVWSVSKRAPRRIIGRGSSFEP
jgi:hypothetical protein